MEVKNTFTPAISGAVVFAVGAVALLKMDYLSHIKITLEGLGPLLPNAA